MLPMNWLRQRLLSASQVGRRLWSPGRFGSYPDFEQDALEVIDRVRPYTMTSAERLYALIQALKYIVRAGIQGDIVECGVWKGGSMMAAALTLLALGDTSRELYLFDTFEGMSQPTEEDIDVYGRPASRLLASKRRVTEATRAFAPEDAVRSNLATVGYPSERLNFVKGQVEKTIPSHAPPQIALLRLDTDWYDSTRHELIHLLPRLSVGGVLIVDDYGHWRGAKHAVDEYLAEQRISLLLNRIDYTGRIAIKC
jgi:O-methyltransferase